MQFMMENVVKAGWRDWIMSKDRVWRALADSIQELDRQTPYIPSWENILAAFRHCPRSYVKVVLLGHDPIPDENLATGVAFSFPEGTIEADVNKPSMSNLHDVLRRVYPDSPPRAETSCCHLNWAREGALLLNTALTYTDRRSQGDNKTIWIGFIRALLQALLEEEQSEMVVMFWGTFAMEVYRDLNSDEELNRHRLFMGHHPTFHIYTKWNGNFLEGRSHPYTEEDDFATQAFEQFSYIENTR